MFLTEKSWGPASLPYSEKGDENMTLGQRIQALRKQHGLSQEGLGERLGVSRQAISRWEMDGAVPEVDKLIAMARLFGVSLNQNSRYRKQNRCLMAGVPACWPPCAPSFPWFWQYLWASIFIIATGSS